MPYIRGMALILVVLLAGALGFKWHFRPMPNALVTVPASAVPLSAAGFVSPPDDAETWKREAAAEVDIPRSSVISRTYTDGTGGTPIEFLLVSGSGRTALHDPRLCLTGSGWKLSNARTEPVPGTPLVMERNEAATVSSVPDTSLDYFYIIKGKPVSSPTEIRFALMESALLGRDNAPVYFFRFIQPLSPDPARAASDHRRLQAFAAEMWRTLRPHLRDA